MKNLPANFLAKLSDKWTDTCLCIRITLRNGTVLAFTNHDRDVTVNIVD